MSIHREDVLRVAELAHLDLTDEEVSTYLRQLDSILSYISKLNELDTASAEPMAQVLSSRQGEAAALREDAVRPDAAGKQVLARAADGAAAHFRVPKVIER